MGDSGLVSTNHVFGLYGACLQPQAQPSVSSDENSSPQGSPIIFWRDLQYLAVYVSDGSYVRAYYDLAHDAALLGSGTTQLAPACSISIPAGDDVAKIAVQWLRS